MRFALLPLLMLAVASAPACQTSKSSAPTTPPTGLSARPAEYARLDRFLGSWEGTATTVKATGDFAEMMPKTDGGSLPTHESGESGSWVFGDHVLKMEGWHAMPEGGKQHFTEFIRWDADQGKYRMTYFSESGDYGEGWMEVSGPDGFSSTYTGTMHGQETKGKGKMTFVSPDRMEWTWTMDTEHGAMEMRGTNTRK